MRSFRGKLDRETCDEHIRRVASSEHRALVAGLMFRALHTNARPTITLLGLRQPRGLLMASIMALGGRSPYPNKEGASCGRFLPAVASLDPWKVQVGDGRRVVLARARSVQVTRLLGTSTQMGHD